MQTWQRLMIYCVSFIGVFFIEVAIDLACGPEPDPYDYYISFFHNNLQKDDSYSPFYFNGYTFLNGYSYTIENNNKAYEQNLNVAEWIRYIGGVAKPKDTYKILYLLDKRTDSLYFWNYSTTGKRFPDSLKTNTFVKALNRNKKAMYYLVLAKKTEPLVTPGDSWDGRAGWDKNKQHEFALKYIEDGKKVTDKFLKLRYFYQAQRLLHYGRYFKEAEDVYDKHIKSFPSESHIKNWALGLKAGEEEQLGRDTQAAHLYAKEFALCPERRVQAYYDFRNTGVPVEQAIKAARNNAEKAVIYGMEGFHKPGIDLHPLRKVYRTSPRSEMVSVLLIREINKIEEGYLTAKINGSNYYDSIAYWDHKKYDSVKAGFINYIPKLKAFCNRLATENKYPEPALGYIASAYLSWITGDTKNGLGILRRIDNSRIRGKLYDQEQLIKLLLLSQKIKKLDDTSEAALLPALKWLNQKVKHERTAKISNDDSWGEYDLKYYASSSRDFYKKVLAKQYLKQKDTVIAALCILRSERTLLNFDRWDDDFGLGFDMPEFWQTKLHSYHINKILALDHASSKTAYLSLLLSSLHEATATKITSFVNANGGNYRFKRQLRLRQTAMPGLYDILGTAYLREHKYGKAAATLKKISIAKLNHSVTAILGSPVRYRDPFTDEMTRPSKTYKPAINNKLQYALTMSRLQKLSCGNSEQASRACYRMANGLYNTSYYGNSWFYTAYSWADSDKYLTKGLYYYRDFLRERTAERWYLKARQLSHDPEFKARCTFMAAKCRQKNIPIPRSVEEQFADAKFDIKFKGNNNGFDQKVRNNPYFKELKDHYSKTRFFTLAVSECSYFRDFLKSENKK